MPENSAFNKIWQCPKVLDSETYIKSYGMLKFSTTNSPQKFGAFLHSEMITIFMCSVSLNLLEMCFLSNLLSRVAHTLGQRSSASPTLLRTQLC